jgi:hypothetical protein
MPSTITVTPFSIVPVAAFVPTTAGISSERAMIAASSETLKKYEEKHSAYLAQKAEWAKLVNEPTVSKDGHHVELAANPYAQEPFYKRQTARLLSEAGRVPCKGIPYGKALQLLLRLCLPGAKS